MIKILVVATLMGLLSGCASYMKRQACEKTDWHKHGFDVAMSGVRLNTNSFIKDCGSVEAQIDYAAADNGFKAGMAKYCSTDVAYSKGIEGSGYNYNFCDSNKVASLGLSFNKGRNTLCTRDGFKMGASGEKYNGQCRSFDEGVFLKNFNRGREKYLKGELRILQGRSRAINREIRNKQYRLLRLNSQMSNLIASNPDGMIIVIDPMTKGYKSTEDENLKDRKNNLQSSVGKLERDISGLKAEQSVVESKITEFTRELYRSEN